MNRLRRSIRGAAVAAVALALLGGCSKDAKPDGGAAAGEPVVAADGLHFLTDLYVGRGEASNHEFGWYRTLDDMTPNVTYVRASGERVKLPFIVAVGTITDVAPGKGFRVEGEDAPSGAPTDFADGRARWWTAHLTVAVDHGIGTDLPDTIRVSVPSSAPADFAKLRAGFKALGQVVLLLRQDPTLTPYDTSLYWLQEEAGLMLATVAQDGALAMPFIDEKRAAQLLANTRTLRDLEDHAKLPKVVPIVGTGADERRADGK